MICRQYFHKAICQSGTASMEWLIQQNPMEKTIKLAQLTGCNETRSDRLLGMYIRSSFRDILRQNSSHKWIFCDSAHLMNLTAAQLHEQLFAVLTPDEKRRGLPMIFKPVIEMETVSNHSPRRTCIHLTFHSFAFCFSPKQL